MAVMQGVFLAIGSPLLDISCVVDDEFIEKYDVSLNSTSIAEERHLRIFEELSGSPRLDPTFVAGGSGQNVIRICQWMLGVPGATSFMGCIGKDEYGETMKVKTKKKFLE